MIHQNNQLMNVTSIIKSLFLTYILLFSMLSFAQTKYKIDTSDIDNFWIAYDHLKDAKTKIDSVNIMQTFYIDKASEGFKRFIKLRNFTAKEYILKIGRYPKFWNTVRHRTEQIKHRTNEIVNTFEVFKKGLPNFKKPKVCFVIGCLRTGGTVYKDLILIGSEIAAADHSVETSELSKWLKSVIGKTGDITSMIAHETVHTQQKNKRKLKLLNGVMNEGIADFITEKLLQKNINKNIFTYGMEHECALRKEFLNDLNTDPESFYNWIYNGSKSKFRPADLGYFIGYRIAEAYYNKQSDKRRALKDLLNQKKYTSIFEESGYAKEACN